MSGGACHRLVLFARIHSIRRNAQILRPVNSMEISENGRTRACTLLRTITRPVPVLLAPSVRNWKTTINIEPTPTTRVRSSIRTDTRMAIRRRNRTVLAYTPVGKPKPRSYRSPWRVFKHNHRVRISVLGFCFFTTQFLYTV